VRRGFALGVTGCAIRVCAIFLNDPRVRLAKVDAESRGRREGKRGRKKEREKEMDRGRRGR